MGIAFVILVFSNAFFIVKFSPRLYYKLHRFSGQLLYLKAAAIGVIVLIATYMLIFYTNLPSFLKIDLNARSFLNNLTFEAYLLLLISPFIVSLICLLGDRIVIILSGYNHCQGFDLNQLSFTRKIKRYHNDGKKIIIKNIVQDSPIDYTLSCAIENQTPLTFTMPDGKFYVGIVTMMSEPNEIDKPAKEFIIILAARGYIDKVTLEKTSILEHEGDVQKKT